MSIIDPRSEDRAVEDLVEDRFRELDGVIVKGPRDLVAVVLAHCVDLRQASLMDAGRADAMDRVATLLDKARRQGRPLLSAEADTLAGQHRLVQARWSTFGYVAGLLAQAFVILDDAGIRLAVSAARVQDPDGRGWLRQVALDAAAVPGGRAAGRRGCNRITEGVGETEPTAARATCPPAGVAALIAAGYLARHPDGIEDMPALVRRIDDALKTCGTLPAEDEALPAFADRLAKTLTPRRPRRMARGRAAARKAAIDA